MMAIFAHPDDESMGPGGTIARYVREGVAVYLICATRGEAGRNGDPPICSREEVGAVRERELRNACEVLGIKEIRFLDYVDQQLGFCDREEAVGKITRIIRELRPHVVITFGPDGITGHVDHVALHPLATMAFHAAGDKEKYPNHFTEGLWPWTPQKLYYTAPSWRLFMALGRKWPEGMENEITTVIEVEPFLDIKKKALACHRTQRALIKKYMDLDQENVRKLVSNEYFRLAVSLVGKPEGLETDLFSGLR